MSAPDFSRYAACEIQNVGGERRLVRLHSRPMPSSEVLPWLVEQGLVKRTKIWDEDEGETFKHHGWGTTYCAAPWDRSVPR